MGAVTMTHTDTAQQQRILRSSKTARVVRKRFAPGTSVRGTDAGQDAPVGTVQYTVPGLNAQGGTIVVQWPNGRVGRHSACSLTVVEQEA